MPTFYLCRRTDFGVGRNQVLFGGNMAIHALLLMGPKVARVSGRSA